MELFNSLDKYIYSLLEYKSSRSFWVDQKMFLFKEIAYFLDWGVSINEAIQNIIQNTDDITIRKICKHFHSQLKQWENLRRAMYDMNQYFNRADINTVKGWENSWELARVLNYLSNEYKFLKETKNEYLLSMLYPVFLLLVVIVVVFVMFAFILPNIFDIISGMGDVQPPWTARVLIGITNFFQNNYLWIIIFTFLSFFGASILYSIDEGRKYIHKKAFDLPLIGKLTKYYFLLKFLKYLKLFLSAGLSYDEVFRSLRSIMTNLEYQSMIDDILLDIDEWESITKSMDEYDIIPNRVVSILRVGEKTAQVEESLWNVIDFYSQEFNKMLQGFGKILEPALVVFVWLIVWFVAMSVFGIIWQVLDWVSSF